MRRVTLLLTSLSLLAVPGTASAAPAVSTAVSAAVSAAVSTAVSTAATTPSSASCRAPVVAPDDSAAQQRVVGVRAGRHDGQSFDRVVFDLTGVPGYRVQHVRNVVQDGSGETIDLRGRASLTVRLEPTVAHDERGHATAPLRLVRSFTELREVRLAGDHEGVVTYGIGLARRTDFRVTTLRAPDRLVVDLALPGTHPFDCRGGVVDVVFASADATPAVVQRRVPAPGVARGALTALFAGPSDFDRPAGLTFVNSDATGFADLRIADGVARVRLTGGCASGGSTFTIANEIIPTLKQFATVDVVKVLDPQGRTEEPTRRVDSIPTCLEP